MTDKEKIKLLIKTLSFYADEENWSEGYRDEDDWIFTPRLEMRGDGYPTAGEKARDTLTTIGTKLPEKKKKEAPKETVMWTMANGRKISITDMDDNHLKNCIRLVERRAKNTGLDLKYSSDYKEMVKESKRRLKKQSKEDEEIDHIRSLLEPDMY